MASDRVRIPGGRILLQGGRRGQVSRERERKRERARAREPAARLEHQDRHDVPHAALVAALGGDGLPPDDDPPGAQRSRSQAAGRRQDRHERALSPQRTATVFSTPSNYFYRPRHRVKEK